MTAASLRRGAAFACGRVGGFQRAPTDVRDLFKAGEILTEDKLTQYHKRLIATDMGVAAADALSGARPGARREQQDNYAEKLADLERIGNGFRGVERAFAVQGGREVRVYVDEQVPDLRAIELSSEIAKQISDEMTFPGQIKVTVIREKRAVEIAG